MPTPRFTVTYEDGSTEELRMRPRAQMAYESDTNQPLFQDTDEIRMTTIYTMAWYAAGKPDTLDGWIANIDDVEMQPLRTPKTDEESGDADHPPTAEDSSD
jgi:hypothetical protein